MRAGEYPLAALTRACVVTLPQLWQGSLSSHGPVSEALLSDLSISKIKFWKDFLRNVSSFFLSRKIRNRVSINSLIL